MIEYAMCAKFGNDRIEEYARKAILHTLAAHQTAVSCSKLGLMMSEEVIQAPPTYACMVGEDVVAA